MSKLLQIRTGQLVWLLLLCAPLLRGQTTKDINVLLMNTTFQLNGNGGKGPAGEDRITAGTVFFMGKPVKDEPDRLYNVLITAAHVLDDMVGDDAVLMLRHKDQDGSFQSVPFSIKIRNNGHNLYTKHPDADVAAMYLAVPHELELAMLPLFFLADDTRLSKLEVHPGDQLLCLGFPLSISLNTFPVIRGGILASYPLVPSRVVKHYFYDFHMFPGNSGGPVYFSFANRTLADGTQVSKAQGVIGIVVQYLTSKQPGYENAQMDVAKIVPSSFILETIALLPASPPPAK